MSARAVERQGGLCGQRMLLGYHEHQVLVEEVRHDDLVSAQGEGDHGQVELARGQLELELGARSLADVEVDVGVAFPQHVEELGDQPATGGADHAQADRADHLLAQGGDVGHHVGELVHDPPGPADDDLTLLGEAAGGAVDQLHIELPLEPGDMGGHVGLHRADRGRCSRETARVSDAQECLQVFQFHDNTPFPGIPPGARGSNNIDQNIR